MHPETRVEMHIAEVKELAHDYSIDEETLGTRVSMYKRTLSSMIERTTVAEVDDVVLWLKQEIRSREELPNEDEIRSKAREICDERGYQSLEF